MTPKEYLDITKDVISAVETDLVGLDGHFVAQPDFKDDEALVAAIEAAYKAHGGTVNANVDKVISGIEAILSISGIVK